MAASASDIRAGGAFVQMSLKDDVTRSLDRLQARVKGWGQVFASLVPTTLNPVKYFGQVVRGYETTDEKTKALTGRVGGLVGALRILVHSSADAAAAFTKVGLGIGAAGTALGAPLAALFKGGVDRAANLARLSRQLGLPIAVLNKLQYAADAAGVSLDEVMQDRTGRYADLVAKAPSIDAADARAAAEAELALADATRAVQDALVPLIQIVAPLVKDLAAWVKENAGVAAGLAGVAAGAVAVGGAIAAAGLAVGALAAAGPGLLLLAKGIVAASVAAATFAVAVAPFVAAGYAFATLTGAGKRFTAWVRTDLVRSFDTARAAWGAFSAALGKGDLTQAMDVAAAGLELVWAGAVLRLETGWVGFKGFVIETTHDLVAGVEDAFTVMSAEVQKTFASIGAVIENTFKAVVRGVIDRIASVAAALKDFDPTGVLNKGVEAANALKDKLGGDVDIGVTVAEKDRQRDTVLAEDARNRDRARGQRETARAGQLTAAQGEVTAANEKLRVAVEAARQARTPGADHPLYPVRDGLLGGISVKGTASSSSLTQQLGYGSELNRPTQLLTTISDTLKGQPVATARAIAEVVRPGVIR